MVGEPEAVILKRGLVAVAAFAGVAADVEDGGKFLDLGAGGDLRAIEIPGHVEPWFGLKVELLDDGAVRSLFSGDRCLERRLLGDGPEAEHVHVFLVEARPFRFPVFKCLGAVEEFLRQLVGLGVEILLNHLIAGLGFVLGECRLAKQCECKK